MVADYEWKVTYDEARQMVLEALAPMGEEYVAKVKEGFETGWLMYMRIKEREREHSRGEHMELTLMYSLISQEH